MGKHLLRLILIDTLLTLFTACQAPSSGANKPDLPAPAVQPSAGRYTSANSGHADGRFTEVSITQAGTQYSLDFGFGYLDGHGAAPDASGTGSLDAHGVLGFQFEDSFSNKGRGTFRTDQNGHWLSIQIDQVEEPRCLPFYSKTRMVYQNRNSQD